MTGVIGNVTTCVVIAGNSYMHTATNYYLFSLAISDMLPQQQQQQHQPNRYRHTCQRNSPMAAVEVLLCYLL